MKKLLKFIATAVMLIGILFTLTGCPNNDQDNNETVIPPDLERFRESESGWQSSNGESSSNGFSITIEGEEEEEIIITDSQTIEIDLNNPNAQSGSHRSSSSSNTP